MPLELSVHQMSFFFSTECAQCNTRIRTYLFLLHNIISLLLKDKTQTKPKIVYSIHVVVKYS